eukprot:jgi/Hompol1/649/HPOL_001482-RA
MDGLDWTGLDWTGATKRSSSTETGGPHTHIRDSLPLVLVPIDAAYDLSIKVHNITSEALLFRMNGGSRSSSPGDPRTKYSTSHLRASSASPTLPSHADRALLHGSSVRRPVSSAALNRRRHFSSSSNNNNKDASSSDEDSYYSRRNRYTTSSSSGDEFHSAPNPRSNYPYSRKPYSRPPGLPQSQRPAQPSASAAVIAAAKKRVAVAASAAASAAASSNLTDPEEKARKRKVIHSTASPGECTWCGVRKTAQWRKGPTGPRGLCNACGLEWAKQIKHEARRLGISAI